MPVGDVANASKRIVPKANESRGREERRADRDNAKECESGREQSSRSACPKRSESDLAARLMLDQEEVK
jgi:hypothetical protein